MQPIFQSAFSVKTDTSLSLAEFARSVPRAALVAQVCTSVRVLNRATSLLLTPTAVTMVELSNVLPHVQHAQTTQISASAALVVTALMVLHVLTISKSITP
jgi:hypothetical protein